MHSRVVADRASGSAADSGRTPLRVAVLASGRGSNFQVLAEAVARGELRGVQLIGVFSDKPAAPVLALAARYAVDTLALDPKSYPGREEFDRALFAAVAAVQPDLIVCAGYMRIIGAAALAPWIGRMINIHPSLLPKYPGLHTHRRALAAGDREHGASVHFVTAELDGGPLIAQARVAVEPEDDEQRLAQRLLPREHALLRACVAALAAGRISCRDGHACWDGQPLPRPLLLTADGQLVSA